MSTFVNLSDYLSESLNDISVYALRLLLAALLGGLIGWERERRNKQAGLKTHLLVSVGSALIMLTSVYGFESHIVNHPNARFDPARLAAQVVSGIGFLGAGAIVRRSDNIVSGLTTAATLWVAAAIGLSVGAGFYFPSVMVTAIVLFCTMLLNRLETRILPSKRSGSLVVGVNVREDRQIADITEKITQALEKTKMKIVNVRVTDQHEGPAGPAATLEFQINGANKKRFQKLHKSLAQIEGIRDIRMSWHE